MNPVYFPIVMVNVTHKITCNFVKTYTCTCLSLYIYPYDSTVNCKQVSVHMQLLFVGEDRFFLREQKLEPMQKAIFDIAIYNYLRSILSMTSFRQGFSMHVQSHVSVCNNPEKQGRIKLHSLNSFNIKKTRCGLHFQQLLPCSKT